MNDPSIGLLLMAFATFWVCGLVWTAMRSGRGVLEVDLLDAFMIVAIYVAGRVVAGRSVFELFLEVIA